MAGHEATGFAALLAPGTIADFLADNWEAEPLHVCGDQARFADLIGLADIERLIAAAPDRPGQRGVFAVRSDGDTSTEYPLGGSSTSGHKPPAVYQALENGYTIVINQIGHIDESVSGLCADVADHLQHPVGCNLYLTPGRACGFKAHRDYQDTFFVQLSGTKHWSLWAPEPDGELPIRFEPITSIDVPTGPATVEFELSAGDVLYMPRGWIHAGTTSNEPSLHITLGARVTTWFDVLSEQLRTAAMADRRFRTAVPLHSAAGDRLPCETAHTARGLLGGVGAQDAEGALASLLARRVSGQHPPLASRVGGIFGRDAVCATTIVGRARGLAPIVVNSPDVCRIAFAGSSVTGPPEAREAFEFVLGRREFAICELPGLPAEAQLDLVRELIVQGCLVVVGERRGAEAAGC